MNIIQKKLLSIAGFDVSIVRYCGTQLNTSLSIGVFFIFQYIAIFISFYILFYDFIISNALASILFSLTISFLFRKMIRYFLVHFHQKFSTYLLVVILLINILILSIVASIFSLKIFESEIFYDLLLKGDYYGKYKITKHLYSLLYQIRETETGFVIILFWVAIFLLLQFIFTKPYFDIYSTRRTIYYTIRKNYEQNF